MAWDSCSPRTSAVANCPGAFAPRNYRKQKLLFSLRIVSTRRVGDLPILFAENFFHVPHFSLDLSAHFLRGAAISQIWFTRDLARLFLDGAAGFLHASLDLVLRARLHT